LAQCIVVLIDWWLVGFAGGFDAVEVGLCIRTYVVPHADTC